MGGGEKHTFVRTLASIYLGLHTVCMIDIFYVLDEKGSIKHNWEMFTTTFLQDLQKIITVYRNTFSSSEG